MQKLGWIQKALTIVLVLIAFAAQAVGQVDTAWVRTWPGDYWPLGVECDTEGNVYVVGVPRSSNPPAYIILKYSPEGDVLWDTDSQDGPVYGETPTDMASDGHGSIHLVGTFHGPDDNRDLGILKYSPDGQMQWVRYLDGRDHGREELGSIAIGSVGEVYVAGRTRRTCIGISCAYQNDLIVGAYTSDGSALWHQQYLLPESLDASVQDLVTCPEGGVAVAGAITEAYQEHGKGLIERVGSDGNPLWSSLRAGIGLNGAFCRRVEVDGLGNLIAGYCRAHKFQVVKYSQLGDSLWVCEPQLISSGIKFLHDLKLDSQGNTLVAGYVSTTGGFTSEQVVFKVSPQGEPLWNDTINGPVRGTDHAYRLAITNSDEVLVAGDVDTDSGSYVENLRLTLTKYDTQGHRVWAIGQTNEFPLSRSASPRGLTLDPNENIILAAGQWMDDESVALTTIKLIDNWNVSIDFLPASCPNIINTGVIDLDYRVVRPGPAAANRPNVPVAILGTKAFDVGRVDPSTIEIAGLSHLSHRLLDVSRPVEPRETECECTTAGADGHMDLVLYFDQEQFVAALGPVNDGEVRTLELTGKTKTGVPLSGSDCVTIKEGPTRISPLASAGEKIEAGFAAYPNPFNTATVVSFSLSTDADVRLDVYDVLGRRVATLVDDMMPAGEHQVSWDATGWASGVYFARLATSAGMMTRKMVLVR